MPSPSFAPLLSHRSSPREGKKEVEPVDTNSRSKKVIFLLIVLMTIIGAMLFYAGVTTTSVQPRSALWGIAGFLLMLPAIISIGLVYHGRGTIELNL